MFKKVVLPATLRYARSSSFPKDGTRSDQQVTSYTAKDIEFSPNRAKDVMQNNVETSELKARPYHSEGKKFRPPEPTSEADHMAAYMADSSVSLHAVMQSNVPEPFATKGKSPTNLNMPGGSSTKDYKYLSGKMQNTHYRFKD